MDDLSKCKLYNPEKQINLRELLSRSCHLFANKVAFEYKKTPKDQEIVEITYAELKEDVEALATCLLSLGLENKRVALIAPNRYSWCVSYLAITGGNMVVVPLDKSLPSQEIEDSIIRSKADAVIFDSKYADTFLKIKNDTNNNLKYYICMDSGISTENFLSYDSLIQKGKEKVKLGDHSFWDVEIDSKKTSVMLFTSGTTSLSKIVCLSQDNICTNVYQIGCMAKVTSQDTFLSFLPLHHTFECTTTFLYGLYCGITIAFCDGLRYIVDNLKQFKITGFVCVPIATKISNFLLKFHIDIRRKVFKSVLDELGGYLRVIVYGAAPMDKNTIIGLSNFGINMLHGYGLTETSPVVSAENDKYKRPGSVGFPMVGVNIKIDHPNEDGIGEILIKGPNVMKGYYENEEATKECLKDGWFYSGDLGYYDKDGYLFVTGRKKSVIVLKNGKNIYPEELEILISKLPYVSECIVYGRPDKDGDLQIATKIVYKEDVMKELYPEKQKTDYYSIIWEDIKKINKTIPTYKYIKHLIITTEELIKTTTQKVKRHEEIARILKEEY